MAESRLLRSRHFAEQQFAENLHAYSLPRSDRVNTRTKDLIDMVLGRKEGAGTIPAKKLLELVRLLPDEEIRFKLLKLDDSRLAIAIEATFAKRAPHAVPHKLEPPPSEWGPVFAALAQEVSFELRAKSRLGSQRYAAAWMLYSSEY